MQRLEGAMGSWTITQPPLIALTFHLPEMDYHEAFDTLDDILLQDEQWHQANQIPYDYLSACIHRWALDILLASHTVDPSNRENVTHMAHERIDAFMQNFFINPLDRAPYDQIVLGNDGWPWELWMYTLCRDIFDARSPFDGSPMVEKPPAHLLALKVFSWINENFPPLPPSTTSSTPSTSTRATSASMTIAPQTPATTLSRVVVLSTSSQMATRVPETAKLEPAKMIRLAKVSRTNADVRTALRVAFTALCEKAWERRMHESLRQDLQALRVHVNQRTTEVETRSLEGVCQAKEETRKAKEVVATMVTEQRQTQENTLRACQDQLDFQKRTHEESMARQQALVASMRKEQTAEIEILRQQSQAAQIAHINARRTLETQVDTLNQTHATDRERLERQLEQAQREQVETVALAARTRQETAELRTRANASDRQIEEAAQRIRIAEERNRQNDARIDSLKAENAATRRQLNEIRASAPQQRSRRCVVS